ncbi:hypothetical protein EWF20_02855 [Sulfolobus sp. S-194]|uniref:hypothetical protein n=1 Tax=Sulfolobus sp. S-194 TaxID=2512240 RepID=UPI001437157B|nr:hypothetical protein [Sulfolobus sp. S-194]QIW23185.1 hypothetical protein EWF20_02855 [Sulfolobus sp. S-194]
MKIYETGVKYERAFLYLSVSVALFILIPVFLSIRNIPNPLFIILEYVFDISFFCLIFFGILTVIAINKGKIIIYDDKIEIKKFRHIVLPWNEIKDVDIRYKSLVVSPITRKIISRKALEIYTVHGKTFSIEVQDPEKIINIARSRIKL